MVNFSLTDVILSAGEAGARDPTSLDSPDAAGKAIALPTASRSLSTPSPPPAAVRSLARL